MKVFLHYPATENVACFLNYPWFNCMSPVFAIIPIDANKIKHAQKLKLMRQMAAAQAGSRLPEPGGRTGDIVYVIRTGVGIGQERSETD